MTEGVAPLPAGRSTLRWLTRRRGGAKAPEASGELRQGKGDEAEREPSPALWFLLDLVGIAICAYVVWEGAELLIATVGR